MKKKIWMMVFVILGIVLLIKSFFNYHVMADEENYSTYYYNNYNFEGAFEYSRQGSWLYPYSFGSYNLRGYPMQNYVLANYSPNAYGLGSYLYRYYGGGYPMQQYVLANYGFSGFNGFY